MKKKPKKSARGGARPGAGRPPAENKLNRRTFTITDDRWAAWQQAAQRAGVSLSEWIRAAGDAYLKSQ